MPPKLDPIVEARILDSARKLWIKGGDEALSMRAIARAARTNTPAIYRRFRHRKDILRALVRGTQQQLVEVLEACKSLEEAGQRVFEFAMAHQREYQLITSGLLPRINEPRPGFELLKRRSAEWFGGSPQDYTRLVLAVFSLVHGTAMLSITKTAPKGSDNELLSVLNTTLGVVIQNRAALSVNR
jgi:AcrR family transcriptional regulator